MECGQNVMKFAKTMEEPNEIYSNAKDLFETSKVQSNVTEPYLLWDAYAFFLRTNIAFVQIMHRMMMNATEHQGSCGMPTPSFDGRSEFSIKK